jgi:nicotinamidase/pyrazinamidase
MEGKREVMAKNALIVVDVQNDFCEKGALAASDTNSLLKPLKEFVEKARKAGAIIVYTQDWHPAAHSSFQTNGGPWPVHCVAESAGAQLKSPLSAQMGDIVIHKGVEVGGAGYSGFEATELLNKLKSLQVNRLGVTGIATEYCVAATALDGAKAGFGTSVLTDLIRAVDAKATAGTLEKCEAAGVETVLSEEWLESL